MTEVIYYVAASLDGYIATPEGGVDWLSVAEQPGQDYGYAEFLASMDAMVMGSVTYEQVLTFGAWPYGDKPCWVLSGRPLAAVCPAVTVTSQTLRDLSFEWEERGMRRVWLVGGATLAAAFRAEELISEYVLTVVPVILGAGIPLFAARGPRESLALVESMSYESGVVQLTYTSGRRR